MDIAPSKLPLVDYRSRALRFTYAPALAGYVHNFERDVQLFVLWEKSRPYWEVIIADIRSHFIVIDEIEIQWSAASVDNNFLRLYGMAPETTPRAEGKKGRSDIVGGGAFTVVVVEDPAPVYVYNRTYSQKVELVNKNIVEAKARYRLLAEASLYVHSSNSIKEFFRDGALILGLERMHAILRTPYRGARSRLERDLSGDEGWNSLAELFDHLKVTVDYVVLRNFDDLPRALEAGDPDLDVLCIDAEDFAAVSGGYVTVKRGAKFSCEIRVAGQMLPVDVRFVGDGYYDPLWEKEMLEHSELRNGVVVVPSSEHHFFSLLYHAKLHKTVVKDKYRTRLTSLARSLGLEQPDGIVVTDDNGALPLLAGYLYEKDFDRTAPLDIWVEQNPAFARKLDSSGPIWSRTLQKDRLLIASLLSRLPLVWRVKGRFLEFVVKVFRYARSRYYAG
jgi:hypothetical protein